MESKTRYIIIGLCLIIGMILGTTTAWYTWTSSMSTDVTFNIGGLTITYEAGYDITRQNLRPTSSKETGVTNNYAIKKDITVSATKTAYLNLYLTAETLPEILSHESLKWEVYEGSTLLNSGNFSEVSEGNKITLLKETEINNTTRNISLYIWIDGNIENPSGMANQNYKFVLNADASDKLPDSLQTLTNLGLTQYLNEGTPNFANVATEDEGIYAAEDDLGTSYYFRGAVENNYVKFGVYPEGTGYYMYNNIDLENKISFFTKKECETDANNMGIDPSECTLVNIAGTDMYWRIIRINGDGMIRMIYDGTSPHQNGESSDDRSFGSHYDNFYNGGVVDNDASGTGADYEVSKIKIYVEKWYDSYLLNSTYNQYVTDSIYCNDKKF